MLRKRSIARSRLRKGRCELSARLLAQRPVSCLSQTPSSRSSALYDLRQSVTNSPAGPCRLRVFLRNFNAAFLSRGCCQTNANTSQFAQTRRASGRAEIAPLGEGGGAVGLEVLSAVEGALLIEVVEDRGVDGSELL